jgi:VIT1/CCC1 family predicted Fe2+/Mn2+ transporter
MVVEEYGLAPTPESPTLAALSTFAAFILCGLVPLITYQPHPEINTAQDIGNPAADAFLES